MSASGHSKNGMFALYQSQSRLSQNVCASSSFCLSRICPDAAAGSNNASSKAVRMAEAPEGLPVVYGFCRLRLAEAEGASELEAEAQRGARHRASLRFGLSTKRIRREIHTRVGWWYSRSAAGLRAGSAGWIRPAMAA